jgi:hypothetical protein
MKTSPPPSTDAKSLPVVRVLSTPEERAWFDAQLEDSHDLGASRPVGDFLRQVVEIGSQPVALLAWGPACYALKDRDRWISWNAPQRVARLKLIVQNRRFLVLAPKSSSPNLASQAMGAALRALPAQWREAFGYRPLLAESFTDPEAHAGTTYKATNWQLLGTTAGYSRSRVDFYVPNERPKRLWCLELDPKARAILRGRDLPEEFAQSLSQVPGGVLPVSLPQCDSLCKALARVPDPRAGSNKTFRIGQVLTIVAMALLAGRREIAEIHRFGQSLPQSLRRRLCLPKKKGTKAFWRVPGYNVYYHLLGGIDPTAFNQVLNEWLEAQAGELPRALAVDGKMVRDHFGILSLARHTDGAPEAMTVFDQKEDTERCEQAVAAELVDATPSLDNRVITADALHCQRKLARAVVEKGGEYVLQVKGNQPGLEERARAKDATPDTPFLP